MKTATKANCMQYTDHHCFYLKGDGEWRTNVNPLELYKVKRVAILLATHDSKVYRPIQKLEFNEFGNYVSHETEESWGREYCAFPPRLRDLIDVAGWSSELLKDCYEGGNIIEQRICVLERFA